MKVSSEEISTATDVHSGSLTLRHMDVHKYLIYPFIILPAMMEPECTSNALPHGRGKYNRTHALKILKNVSENFPLPRSQWKYTFCCKTQVGLETRCNFRKGARREVEINVIIVSIFVEPSLLYLALLIKFSFINFTLEYWLIQSID